MSLSLLHRHQQSMRNQKLDQVYLHRVHQGSQLNAVHFHQLHHFYQVQRHYQHHQHRRHLLRRCQEYYLLVLQLLLHYFHPLSRFPYHQMVRVDYQCYLFRS